MRLPFSVGCADVAQAAGPGNAVVHFRFWNESDAIAGQKDATEVLLIIVAQ